jgi:FkbM family methyltransferase
MRGWMWQTVKAMVDGPLHLLSRQQRIHLGRHILDTALGDNNSAEESNGEYWVLDQVKRHLKQGAAKPTVVFDVGARIGEWSLRFAQDMQDDAVIYAFEPTRKSYQQLKEMFATRGGGPESANGAAKLTAVNVALGDHTGPADMFISGDTAGTNSLYEAVGSYVEPIGKEVVTLARGDDFCRENGISHVDFLKIDTEGHEVPVMRGFEQMLNGARVSCLQFEYNMGWIDARAFLADAFALLLPKGYRIAKIHPRGLQFFERYNQQLERFRYCNYLAMRPEWASLFDVIA